MITKIVSGGQTGVDRAALDVGIARGLKVGGWCPLGRLAEDGTVPEKYPLSETETDHYEERTVRNVAESDGTLILCPYQPTDGTAFTLEAAIEMNKPLFVFQFSRPARREEIEGWIQKNQIHVLNVAGPRESDFPGIGKYCTELLPELLF